MSSYFFRWQFYSICYLFPWYRKLVDDEFMIVTHYFGWLWFQFLIQKQQVNKTNRSD